LIWRKCSIFGSNGWKSLHLNCNEHPTFIILIFSIMKRFIIAALALACSPALADAQSNKRIVDDVYYNGSQAEEDAKSEAKKQQQTRSGEEADYYNSSASQREYYDDGNDGYTYYDTEDDAYIDYDDDSYTTRLRRFYHPMDGMGYWGSVYSPFWARPFYGNPYYGWGGWYTPGFSVGFGWGGGPYWNNCWGMNTWYGYGGFGSWYYPYGAYGWGYGGGYWNGYYAGLYDAGRYTGNYRGAVNYGPRGARSGMLSVGSYGRNSRMAPVGRDRMVQPINGRSQNVKMGTVQRAGGDQNFQAVEGGRRSGTAVRDNNIRLRSENSRAVEVNPNATGVQREVPARRGGLFNLNRGNNAERNINMERSQPARTNTNVERSQPARNYTPAPSRSYTPSTPARSSGGGFGGGGGATRSGSRR
jgi:hypothetical protein